MFKDPEPTLDVGSSDYGKHDVNASLYAPADFIHWDTVIEMINEEIAALKLLREKAEFIRDKLQEEKS